MGRTNWQKKADALEAELATARKELELVTGLHETQRGEVEALKQQLVDADRRVMLARVEGARDACAAIIDAERSLKSAREMGLME